MSLPARREYVRMMRERYVATKGKAARTRLLDEVQAATGYNRKYAVRLLSARRWPAAVKRRQRPRLYQDCLPVIALAWEALDFCCAERLHACLLTVADQLARHHAIRLDTDVRDQLTHISRATLGRRLAGMPKPQRRIVFQPRGHLLHRSEVPLGHYAWDESRPGALEIDLVEHSGGFSGGHFAYTLTVTDVVTGWTRHAAMLGRSQSQTHALLEAIIQDWPYTCWGLHADNGPEFLNDQVQRFASRHRLKRTRSRPYHKNDSPHVEQRNAAVRRLIGYDRYETPESVAWLDKVYELFDPYVNLVLPTMKLVARSRSGSKLRRIHDTPKPPLLRAIGSGAVSAAEQQRLTALARTINPLALHRQIQSLAASGPAAFSEASTTRAP